MMATSWFGRGRIRIASRSIVLAALVLSSCSSAGAEVGDPDEVDGTVDIGGNAVAAPTDSVVPPFEVERGGVTIDEQALPEALPNRRAEAGVLCRSLTFKGLTFDSNEAELSDDGRLALERMMAVLSSSRVCTTDTGSCSRQDLEVELIGHTDNQVSSLPGGNLQLSKDRARAVAAVFIEYGFMKVGVEGRADREPAPAPEPDTRSEAEVRADNRRVTINLLC